MKAQLFDIHQAITPLVNEWSIHHGEVRCDDQPQKNEIYHVLAYEEWNGDWYIYLKEFGMTDCYEQEAFAPVMGDEQFNEELSEIFNSVNA